MYCIKCGVELAESETRCPLCGTRVVHPDIPFTAGEGPYPPYEKKEPRYNPVTFQILALSIALLVIGILILCDMSINGRIVWSGYAVGGILVAYSAALLPYWFPKKMRTPAVFMPVFFAVLISFLLYINCKTGNHWFLSFVFPVVGSIGLILTACAVLCYYIKRGYLFIIGGTLITLGCFCMLLELFVNITFTHAVGLHWCFYPLISLCLIGGLLILIGIVPSLRESVEKRIFI